LLNNNNKINTPTPTIITNGHVATTYNNGHNTLNTQHETLSSFDLSLRNTFNGMHDNNINNANANESSRKQQQTVRFLSNDNLKAKSKGIPTLAESEESIISDSSYYEYARHYGFYEHVK
jgi:hypothetical protein